jgi:hypothetical protein
MEENMKRCTVIPILIAVAVIAFCLGTAWNNPRTVSASGEAGLQSRFEIVEGKFPFIVDGASNDQSMPFMVDTVSGRTWTYEGPTTAKNQLVDPAGWEEADFIYSIRGADGQIHRKVSALPVTTSPGP